MCQYNHRCPVGTHRPGTVCRYAQTRILSAIGGVLAIAAALTFAFPRLDVPILRNLTASEPEGQAATVTRVIDGDTITARDANGNDLGRIRLLGLDAPELDQDECWATQSRDAATNLLDGEDVTLTPDPQNDDRDTYGRLLRYADLGDGIDASEDLIEHGHAPATSNPRQHTRHRDYRNAHEDARDAQLGLWSHC